MYRITARKPTTLTARFKPQENPMKKALIAIWLAVAATTTWAACTTHTIMQGTRMVTCTTCCFGSNCTTNCF